MREIVLSFKIFQIEHRKTRSVHRVYFSPFKFIVKDKHNYNNPYNHNGAIFLIDLTFSYFDGIAMIYLIFVFILLYFLF